MRFLFVPTLVLCTVLGAAPLEAATPETLAPDTVVLTLPLAPGEAPLELTLSQLMAVFKVPGYSIAVIDHDRIAWARGFGVTEPGGRTPVTARTLFQAASISKPLTAAGVLWLVQEGKLSLDEDVNAKLKSWKVPENRFTAAQRVTLRRILCHNAGFNVPGFDGYPQGAPLPTTQQTLDGLPPANNPPVRVTTVPGTQCNYSGGGFTIAGLLMRDVSGQRFEDFMREHVLMPAGMTDSSFEQNLPPDLAVLAATGARRDGRPLPGKWRRFPELAPDGLWSTPTDLASFAIAIALDAQGRSNRVLSRASAHEMLTVQCHDDPIGQGGTGLGFALGYQHRPTVFFHNGSNIGFKSVLMMDAEAGWGYAAMSNSDNFEAVNRRVVQTLDKRNGWGIAARTSDLGELLTIIESLRGAQTALDSYVRAKAQGFTRLRHDVNTLNNFGYRLLEGKKFADAIRVLRLNADEYPQDANVYDSLGEAYMDAGNRDLAIRNYEKSLRLDPKNENAVTRLKKLRSE